MYNKIKRIIIGIFLFLSIIVLFSSNWAVNTFGNLSFDEILYHIKSPLEGTSTVLVEKFIKACLVPSLIITIIITIILFFNFLDIRLICKIKKRVFTLYPFKFKLNYLLIINFLFFLVCLYVGSNKMGVVEYANNQLKKSDFIEENYVDARDTTLLFPKKKKNLIYIYIESLETTYLSSALGGAQLKNLMPNLSKLSNEGINFSNNGLLGGAKSVVGTSWTMAGLFATTAGVPLKVNVDGNSYGNESSFMNGVYSLGDVLSSEGYKNVLMIGSDATFGGRKYYFDIHGKYEIYDYYSAINDNKISSNYFNWWGFEDSKLYKYAKEKLINLAKGDEPFNFTMLTADTHFPDGYLDSSCENKFDDNLSSVIYCTDKMLNDFISWIKKQDFYEDTTIVISGDHLSMDVNFFLDLNPNYERTVYNLYLNSSVKTINNLYRNFATFDLFPTTLASLGVIIEGDRLGLGTNLFSDSETLIEKYGYDYVNNELSKTSKFYNEKLLVE